MNSKNIIIATALLLMASSLLSGCVLFEKGTPRAGTPAMEAGEGGTAPADRKMPGIQELAKEAEQAGKTVNLMLEGDLETSGTANTLTVTVVLENPEAKPVVSAQTWLSFDPAVLKGVSISDAGSDFDIMAPFDNTFDDINGLVMIGRAATEPKSGTRLKMVDAVFEVIGEGPLMINAYDYREDLSGHMSANTLVDEKPYNIMVKPENPALIVTAEGVPADTNPSEQ
jgi:hypothetical protein